MWCQSSPCYNKTCQRGFQEYVVICKTNFPLSNLRVKMSCGHSWRLLWKEIMYINGINTAFLARKTKRNVFFIGRIWSLNLHSNLRNDQIQNPDYCHHGLTLTLPTFKRLAKGFSIRWEDRWSRKTTPLGEVSEFSDPGKEARVNTIIITYG